MDLESIPAIKPKTFYGTAKYRLPPPPEVSDGSDSSDEEVKVVRDNTVLVEDAESDETHSEQDLDEPEPPKKKKKSELTFKWTREDLPPNTRNTSSFVPVTNEELLSPLEYFTKFFSFDLMNSIVYNTNLYSTQQTGKSIDTNPKEITDFLSILLMMGIMHLPSYEDYWANGTRVEQIANLMPIKRFKVLRRFIHFNDNDKITKNTKDRYYKIRPVIEMVRENFRKHHTENDYSIDETMVAYKGTRAGSLRQYIKNKPHKWGYKFFLIAGVSGYNILDFVPYQGAYTFDQMKQTVNELTQEEIGLGVGASVVISLCKSLHDASSTTVYFDNYFSGLPLFVNLKQKMGIYSLGTIRNNRIGGCPIETDKVLKKRGRGMYDYKTDNEKGVIVVKWVDNKTVLLGSTLYGIEPKDTVKRFSKADGQKVEIRCPSIIKNYNKHMGGVDKANSLMGLYKSPSKAKRWYFPIFTYLMDICVVNAWLLYRLDCTTLKLRNKPLKHFRLDIVQALAHTDMEARRVGRPKSERRDVPIIRRPLIERPDNTTRGDSYAHWPIHTTKGRCRYCVKGTTRLMCEKCGARLCLTEKKIVSNRSILTVDYNMYNNKNIT